MGNVIDSDKQEQLGGMSGKYLMQAVIDTHHFITDDAAITYILLTKTGRPLLLDEPTNHLDVLRCQPTFCQSGTHFILGK